jgi:hypothetical protein
MEVQTLYGICKNVDIDHLKEYGGVRSDTASFMFSDFIIKATDDGYYLFFGFEVWRDKGDEFHFFVEEGFTDGSADTYDAGISRADAEEIKKIYYEYMSRRK